MGYQWLIVGYAWLFVGNSWAVSGSSRLLVAICGLQLAYSWPSGYDGSISGY